MAPEIFSRTGHDTKVDIWSFAITAMELAFGRPPYNSTDPIKVMLTILQKDPPTLDSYKEKHSFSRGFASMLSKCLRKNPQKRPTAKKLLTHRFFRRVQDSKYIYEKIISRCYHSPPKNEIPLVLDDLHGKPLAGKTKKNSKPVPVESWIYSEKKKFTLQNERKIMIDMKEFEEEKKDTSLPTTRTTLSKIWSWSSPSPFPFLLLQQDQEQQQEQEEQQEQHRHPQQEQAEQEQEHYDEEEEDKEEDEDKQEEKKLLLTQQQEQQQQQEIKQEEEEEEEEEEDEKEENEEKHLKQQDWTSLSRIWSWTNPGGECLPLTSPSPLYSPSLSFSIWRWSFGWTCPLPKNEEEQNRMMLLLESFPNTSSLIRPRL